MASMNKLISPFGPGRPKKGTHHTVPPLRAPENPYLPAVVQHMNVRGEEDGLPSVFELFAARRPLSHAAA